MIATIIKVADDTRRMNNNNLNNYNNKTGNNNNHTTSNDNNGTVEGQQQESLNQQQQNYILLTKKESKKLLQIAKLRQQIEFERRAEIPSHKLLNILLEITQRKDILELYPFSEVALTQKLQSLKAQSEVAIVNLQTRSFEDIDIFSVMMNNDTNKTRFRSCISYDEDEIEEKPSSFFTPTNNNNNNHDHDHDDVESSPRKGKLLSKIIIFIIIILHNYNIL
jgi:hypothetical protein